MSSRVRMEIQHSSRPRPHLVASVGLALSMTMLTGCAHVPGIYTYEAKKAAGTNGGSFSAASYAQSIFASRIVPTVQAKAVDADTVLSALKADSDAASKKYGKQSGVGSPYAFLVKGNGTVTKVDTTDATGPVTVKLDGAGGFTVTIATGPVLIGTDLRDAVGFIDFSQFTNQIDFADVATQINAQVKTVVLAKLDRAALTGKKVTFAGAFSLTDPTDVVIVPTEIAVAS